MSGLTIYGKNPVLEAVSSDIEIECLHVAEDQRRSSRIREILDAARNRGIDVRFHSRRSLSFISGNSKQDQGVAADVVAPGLMNIDQFCADPPDEFVIVALERIDNQQNLGMAVRSIHAAGAFCLVALGKARLHPLAVKASAGVLLKARVINGSPLSDAIERLREIGTAVFVLDADAEVDLFDHEAPARALYVVGNETEGIAESTRALADGSLSIPLGDDVESLNAAVAASLAAFVTRHSH